MPDAPNWFIRLPEIIATVTDSPAPVLDRASIEALFGVSRRQAIRIMHLFGGYQAGRTFLIGRDELLVGLTRLTSGDRGQQVARRKRRIWEEVTEHRSRVKSAAVEIPGVARFPALTLASLPDGVRLGRGQLQIQFQSPEDLLQKLYLLSQALAEDFDQFVEEYSCIAG